MRVVLPLVAALCISSAAGAQEKAGFPMPNEILAQVRVKYPSTKAEKVELTSGWKLTYRDESRNRVIPDECVANTRLTCGKDAQGEYLVLEGVTHYWRDILKPDAWHFDKFAPINSQLFGRKELPKERLVELVQTAVKEPRVQGRLFVQPRYVTHVYRAAPADAPEFVWKNREQFCFNLAVDYDWVRGSTVERTERTFRLTFSQVQGNWTFMDQSSVGTPKVLSKTEYQKTQIDGMKTLATAGWDDLFGEKADGTRPFPAANEVIQALKLTLGSSEKAFNQILGARAKDGKLEIEELSGKVYELQISERDIDWKQFKWESGDDYSVPVKIGYLWKETQERKVGSTVETTHWKKGESDVYLLLVKKSPKGHFFVGGAVATGQRRTIMDSRIGPQTFQELPPTFKEKFAGAAKQGG